VPLLTVGSDADHRGFCRLSRVQRRTFPNTATNARLPLQLRKGGTWREILTRMPMLSKAQTIAVGLHTQITAYSETIDNGKAVRPTPLIRHVDSFPAMLASHAVV